MSENFLLRSLFLLLLTLLPACHLEGKPPYEAVILNQMVISKEEGRYCGWPSIGMLPSGRLMVVYSGDRDWHVCPWGKNQMVFSDDRGKTWSEPQTIANTPLDDRGAGILVTDQGTILVSWFTSMAFADRNSRFYEERYFKYANHAAQISTDLTRRWLGAWVIRSEDHGASWSEPIRIPFETPHGPIQLRDGRILMVAGAGVAESRDDGLTWQMRSRFRSGFGRLSEVSAVERDDGEIVVLSRAPKLRQFGSSDGGKTWSTPFETRIQGYPPHLVELKNGWLLAVYGRRDEMPMGQFAAISMDGGKSWDTENEITLSIAEAHPGTEEELGYPPSWDLGYPASVLLDDGTIWTVYYQVDQDGEWPSIMGTHWRLEINDRSKTDLTFRHFDSGDIDDAPTGPETHLNIDFSVYRPGPVTGQTGGSKGAWSAGPNWHGQVTAVQGLSHETHALAVYVSAGGALGRGSISICPGAPEVPNSSLRLEERGKIHWSVDLYSPDDDSGIALIMSDTTPGRNDQTGFRLVFGPANRPVSFATSVRDRDGLPDLSMVSSSFVPARNAWHRFEVEITQSSIPGKGIFSVFASTPGGIDRRPILQGQPYSFMATQFPTLFIIPHGATDPSTAVYINNLVLQSGLTEFPRNPF